jgi:phosphoglycolate phosphatase-like HAD superfamily hydrolase
MSPGGGRRRSLLVLDFDGVICDSIDECFVSSWIAYYELYRMEQPPQVPVRLRAEFARLRPFIRSGEDFVLIQSILRESTPVPDQAAFDAAAVKAGADTMRRFKELFYAARRDLLARDRRFWLSLNRVYPHVVAAFARLPVDAPVHILSTKRMEYITESLAEARIHFPHERIHLSPTQSKLPTVEAMRASGGFAHAVFVDDQIDYLLHNDSPRISAYLASWGYVKSEWLAPDSGVAVMNPDDFLALIEKEYALS